MSYDQANTLSEPGRVSATTGKGIRRINISVMIQFLLGITLSAVPTVIAVLSLFSVEEQLAKQEQAKTAVISLAPEMPATEIAIVAENIQPRGQHPSGE